MVLASGGYPAAYRTGITISGLAEAEALPGVSVFHAGTRLNRDGVSVTTGGRVLGVTAVADTLPDAIARAYEAAGRISFEGMHFRRDIGAAALAASRR